MHRKKNKHGKKDPYHKMLSDALECCSRELGSYEQPNKTCEKYIRDAERLSRFVLSIYFEGRKAGVEALNSSSLWALNSFAHAFADPNPKHPKWDSPGKRPTVPDSPWLRDALAAALVCVVLGEEDAGPTCQQSASRLILRYTHNIGRSEVCAPGNKRSPVSEESIQKDKSLRITFYCAVLRYENGTNPDIKAWAKELLHEELGWQEADGLLSRRENYSLRPQALLKNYASLFPHLRKG